MNTDVLVYDVDGTHYIGIFADGERWRWPAKEGGWKERVKSTHPGNDAWELPPKNAALALRLSGVEP